MADTPLFGVSSVSTIDRTATDRAFRALRLQRDGAAFTSEWVMGLVMEGRVFVANVGTGTAPATFNAGPIVTTAPDFDLLIPAGTLGIPLYISIYMEAYGTSAQFECMASVGTGGAQAAATATTPTNLRLDAPVSTVSTVRRLSVGATYHTTNISELFHDGSQFAITKTSSSATVSSVDPVRFVWKWTDAFLPPMMYSASVASRLNVFASSQAGTGFITVMWAELPTAAIG